MELKWNETKNQRLKKTRNISFDEILAAKLVDVLEHPKYANQKVMLFWYKSYIWVVPFVVQENGDYFLKTIFPSRQYTKKFKENRE